jgi:hypothetical protein
MKLKFKDDRAMQRQTGLVKRHKYTKGICQEARGRDANKGVTKIGLSEYDFAAHFSTYFGGENVCRSKKE